MDEITLGEDECLYPLWTQDAPNARPGLTTWLDGPDSRHYLAVVEGDSFKKPYWDAPRERNEAILIVEPNTPREDLWRWMIDNRRGRYIEGGWIVPRERVETERARRKDSP